MNGITGAYVNVQLADLQSMYSDTLAAIKAVKIYKSYVAPGRTLTLEDLPFLQAELAEVSYAIAQQTGQPVRDVYADMSCGG